ncbi:MULTISPECIES: helix-turn-helix transcriptional regulator [unclassified Curtobacterium]|uniref:helix-turn-helix transcriptional regulator n=1 Tax=unclassified Curtobacterium TaxID=257496 RepID=UPI000DA7D60D|nr:MULTISPECIES: helix-turn-helix transcriptional regulator [unclassified Curtobacterium]PZE23266.1 transcriptional regulator [Curtobacterium sp. MCBD17_028]PZE70889.1 transcriptional regulator [Curtobacterium sp. MCBD17_019]WIB65198.1 helix-turn-helix transcriptional regulator [Curtobacterium sp. MCBD17_040]
MDNRAEVREFLSSRRARITPEQAGVEQFGGRRRVAGLRREEVARLAGVSVDYYTRIERGNLTGASDSVLDAIASALSLDRAEHDHLFDLARDANATTVRARAKAPAPAGLPPAVQFMLDTITEAPAFIGNNRMDIVAANTLGYALYSDMYRGTARPANHSRFIFLDPRAYDFYPDWERAANVNVAILRRDAGRNPHDPGIAALVGELSVRSDEFRIRWAAHNVRRHYSGAKSFNHSAVGMLELTYQVMELEDVPGHSLTVYPAAPGTPSADALKLLASWAATERITDKAAATSRA